MTHNASFGTSRNAETERLRVAKFLHVIGEKNRLNILRLLSKRERCVCELWKRLALSQNLTSHHLNVLKKFGLIVSRREGKKIIYAVNKRAMKSCVHSLHHCLGDHE